VKVKGKGEELKKVSRAWREFKAQKLSSEKGKYVKVPAGAVVNIPLEVDIPIGESGYKVFYANLESTKWTPTAMDTGVLHIT